MTNNAQKTPITRSLNTFAQRKVLDYIELTGKALPCAVTAVSGSIVTVQFKVNTKFTLPSVTVPMFGPEYIRYPTQVGDLGVVFPADVRLGGVSGLGGGVADMSLPANLSALVWFPIASKNWSASEDPNATVIYGPDGVILRNVAKTMTLTLKGDGAVLDLPIGKALTVNGELIVNGLSQLNGNIELSGSVQGAAGGTYAGNIHTSGTVTGDTDVIAAGKSGKSHEHGGVQTGGGNTGPPI